MIIDESNLLINERDVINGKTLINQGKEWNMNGKETDKCLEKEIIGWLMRLNDEWKPCDKLIHDWKISSK